MVDHECEDVESQSAWAAVVDAIRELGDIKGAATLSTLLAKAQHKRADVRQAAVEALASAAPRGDPQVLELLEAICRSDHDCLVQDAALVALAALAPQGSSQATFVVSRLVSPSGVTLKSQDWDQWWRAADALSSLFRNSQTTTDAKSRLAVSHTGAGVSASSPSLGGGVACAQWALESEGKGESSNNKLNQATTSSEEHEAWEDLRGICLQALLRALNDESPEVRYAAAHGAGMCAVSAASMLSQRGTRTSEPRTGFSRPTV